MSYGRNKNLDDEKNIAERIPQATRSAKKSVIAAEAITFCIKPFTQNVPSPDLKNNENYPHNPRRWTPTGVHFLTPYAPQK